MNTIQIQLPLASLTFYELPCRILWTLSSTRIFSSIFTTRPCIVHPAWGSSRKRAPVSGFLRLLSLNKRPSYIGSEAFTFLMICPFSLFVFGLFHTSRPRSLLITFALNEPYYIIVFFSFHQCTMKSSTQTLIPTATDGLHPRYVERGSGEMPNKSRPTLINDTSSNTVQYDVARC